MDTTVSDIATSKPKLNDETSSSELNNPTMMSESDLMDFSSSLMDFADDLFNDVDDINLEDRPFLNDLSSILLTSPSHTHQDDVLRTDAQRATKALGSCLVIPDSAGSGESYNICDQTPFGHEVSEINRFNPTVETFVICTLNAEVWDVPFNDDGCPSDQVLLLFSSSDTEQTSRDNFGSVSTCTIALPNGQQAIVEDATIMEKQVAVIQPVTSFRKSGLLLVPKEGLAHSSDGCMMEAESFYSDSLAGVSKYAGITIDEPHSRTLGTSILQSTPVAPLQEESTIFDLDKHESFDNPVGLFSKKPVQGSAISKVYSLNMDDACEQEAAMQIAMQKHVPLHADLVFADMAPSDPVKNMAASDLEEQFSDSENDVPNFCHIESMILDMDLSPYNQKSCLFDKEVFRYQCVATKKAIIRLEEGARAYMNRAILSRGAFAIFYGHYLKYFIKDPEVSLGRSTEEVEVDIDLGREGCANKISRLQAVIKLDEDGVFVLRNIGKCSIFINGREVRPKTRHNLSSNSLVEIRDMSFMFDVNQSAVRHYIAALRTEREQPT